MTFHDRDAQPEARELEADRKRIEEALSRPLPESIREALRRERRWLERRCADRVRHPVACGATLMTGAGFAPARVRDLSAGGAMLELDRPPAAGTRAQLVFVELDGGPSLECVVRHASAEARRAGVEFVSERTVAQRIAREVVERFGASASR